MQIGETDFVWWNVHRRRLLSQSLQQRQGLLTREAQTSENAGSADLELSQSSGRLRARAPCV
jgi:hypothetical protein